MRNRWIHKPLVGVAIDRRRLTMFVSVLVLILIVVELFVRSPYFWEIAPLHSSNQPVEVFKIAIEDNDSFNIALLGNSTVRNAVAPLEFDQYVGEAGPKMTNASITFGVMTTQLALYKQFREDFKRADLLVLNVEPRQFDDHGSFIPGHQPIKWGLPDRFRRFADFQTRLQIDNVGDKLSLITGYYWKTWDVRQSARSFAMAILTGEGLSDKKTPVDSMGRIRPSSSLPKINSDESFILDHARGYSEDYEFVQGVQYNAFVSLLNLVKEDGLKLALMESPTTEIWRDEYIKVLGPEYDNWKAAVETASGTSVSYIGIKFPNEICEVYRDCYLDFGHMTADGAVAFTPRFADWIQELYPELFSQPTSNNGDHCNCLRPGTNTKLDVYRLR